MLPNRIVESCHKTHVPHVPMSALWRAVTRHTFPIFPCPLASWCVLSDQAIHMHSDYGQVYRVIAHVTESAAVHPSCEHPHCLRALLSHSECQKLMRIVTVLPPQFLLWCLVPLVSHIPYVISSYTAVCDFFFFLIHWHQKLFLLSWVHYECRGFFQTQICGGGPLEQNL